VQRAGGPGVREAPVMTTPGPDTPQPRDIAVEQETAEVAADFEAQSEPVARESDES